MTPDRGPEPLPPDRTLLLRQIVPIAALVAFGWLLVTLSPVLVPFVAAAVLAYICSPLVNRLEVLGLPRSAGALLVIVLFVLAFGGMLLVVVPLFHEQATLLAERVPMLLRYLSTTTIPALGKLIGHEIALDLASFVELARQHADSLQGVARDVFAQVATQGSALAGWLGLMLLVPVVMFYLLADWPRIVFATQALVPLRWREQIAAIESEIDQVLAQFLRGQLAVMLALAVFYGVALRLAGIEHALALALITGLLSFIPYVGFGLGLTLALLSSFLQGEGLSPVAWVAAIYTAGQLIESFLLTPRLVGERIGLHPVAVILALLVFAQLLGFLGVLIALPASAALLVAARHALAAYRDSEFFRAS